MAGREPRESQPTGAGRQLPMLEGTRSALPTVKQVQEEMGVEVPPPLYQRVLDMLTGKNKLPDVVKKIEKDDREPDNPWNH